MDERRQRLAREHQQKDDAVFQFFKIATEEINSVFAVRADGKNYTSERVQLVCIFTLVDIVANYWYEYLGRTNGTPRSRFEEWVNKYCLNDQNPEYVGTDFVYLTANDIYATRSSLIHFFGMSGLSGRHKLTFATNSISDDFIARYKKKFQERGHSILVVKPKKLHNLVLEGTLLMLFDWKQIIAEAQRDEEKKWQHIEGIDRIYQKIQLEGAMKVEIPGA
jgi:hypothetical protein